MQCRRFRTGKGRKSQEAVGYRRIIPPIHTQQRAMKNVITEITAMVLDSMAVGLVMLFLY